MAEYDKRIEEKLAMGIVEKIPEGDQEIKKGNDVKKY